MKRISVKVKSGTIVTINDGGVYRSLTFKHDTDMKWEQWNEILDILKASTFNAWGTDNHVEAIMDYGTYRYYADDAGNITIMKVRG